MPTALQLVNPDTGTPILSYEQPVLPVIAEPLGGQFTIDDALAMFPDEVYNKNRDAHLYKFLQALIGDSGVGQLKKQSLIARLRVEGNLITYTDPDTLYSVTFRFPRLPDETYAFDPTSDVLTQAEWADVEARDQHYMNRVRRFMQATRLGNSPEGIVMSAESAIGIEVSVWENYKATYSHLHDEDFLLSFQGQSRSTGEFVLTPHLTADDSLAYTPDIVVAPQYIAATFHINTAYAVGDMVQPTVPNGHTYAVTASSSDHLSGGSEPGWTTDGTAVVSNHVTFTDIGTVEIAAATYSQTTPGIRLVPEYEHNLEQIMDLVRPVGALMTVAPTDPHMVPLTDVKAFASSSNFHLARFVTGRTDVIWPDTDSTTGDRSNGFFIEPGTEHEVVNLAAASPTNPVIYHTIEGVAAYDDRALDDPTYNTLAFFQDIINYQKYIAVHRGPYYTMISLLFPFLQHVAADNVFGPIEAISLQNTPLLFISGGK